MFVHIFNCYQINQVSKTWIVFNYFQFICHNCLGCWGIPKQWKWIKLLSRISYSCLLRYSFVLSSFHILQFLELWSSLHAKICVFEVLIVSWRQRRVSDFFFEWKNAWKRFVPTSSYSGPVDEADIYIYHWWVINILWYKKFYMKH